MNLNKICNEVTAIASDAGNFIKNERLQFRSADVEIKGLNDLVSYVDRNAEQIIISGLKPLIPHSGFIAEENSIDCEEADYQWVIDPLDGTTNFVHGLKPYAVSIGLLFKGSPVLGVIYEIGDDECYSAVKGMGAVMNKKDIHVSGCSSLSESLIITGFPVNEFGRNAEYYQLMDYLIKNTHGVRRLGSAAADLAYVSCGRCDAFYEYNLKPWDVAAGAIIVQEAGGMLGDFSGSPNYVFGKEIVAANNLVFNNLLRIISKYMQG